MYQKMIVLILILCSFLFAELSAHKQTELNLYVTAEKAWQWWQHDQDSVNIIDVRTPAEYIFVGHAPMARNIPFKFLSSEYKDGKPKMTLNPDFLDTVKKYYRETDLLILHCRSGGRSAAAANVLAQAGFSNVYSMTDGFEGDKLDAENSYNNGKRIVNGWKNSGAPWVYTLESELVY